MNIIEKLIYEQKKCSSHSMMITENEFEMELMTLMKLVRNSIMYLALALHMEEKNKPEHEGAVFSREVPMKSE
ncbi:MAG TPA: LA2681 family HEPN domain-containing protein [Arsenophonus apicola]